MKKYIKFTVGGYFYGYKTVEIFINGENAKYKILRCGLLDVNTKIFHEVKISNDWLKKIDALNIFEWKEQYFSEILDGTQWELTFKDGKNIYRGSGSNAFPEDWEKFLDLLDEIAPELEFIHRKRLEKIILNYSRESQIGYTVFEKLTIDRHEKILTLTKETNQIRSEHVYCIAPNHENIFDTCQIFFDNLKIEDNDPDYPLQINIEVLRHDNTIENVNSSYGEIFLVGLANFLKEIKNIVSDLTTEILSPTPAKIIPRQGKYIFCKVQFSGSYKHYTYQTDDETLSVGDIVDVPVGKNNEIVQARLVDIGYFDEYEAPFPVDRIKKIIGKHVPAEWENY